LTSGVLVLGDAFPSRNYKNKNIHSNFEPKLQFFLNKTEPVMIPNQKP